MTKRALVTGASGFVGGTLCDELRKQGYIVRAALRSEHRPLPGVAETIVIGNIGAQTDWTQALRGVDVVLHLAARAHVLGDVLSNDHLYMEVNAHGTRRLAESAADARVRRLVFLSSIKVNGEDSGEGLYGAGDVPQPRDAYARSKELAERSLHDVAANRGLEVVSIRSPLVYGPGVRANFLRLLNWVHRGLPLPLGSVSNRRSLVSLWNLCDLLVRAANHPRAAGGTWMVSDCVDLSTPDLIRRIAAAMNRSAILLPVPVWLLSIGGAALGREAEVRRLCGSLAVDVSRTRTQLDWSPPLTVDASIARTVEWFLSRSGSRES